jgi:tRNA dimethylallyltransferase
MSHNTTSPSHSLLVILGPTASGKTQLAAHAALHLKGEVISADSRQVYRGMNLGTGKDYADYFVNGIAIPCHLIDIANAGEAYNLFEFQKDFIMAFRDITDRGKLPVLCGGSGLYIDAVLKGYQLAQVPVDENLRKKLEETGDTALIDMLVALRPLHNTTDTCNRKRLVRAIEIELYMKHHPETRMMFPELQSLIIGVKYNLEERRQRITARLHQRLRDGMVEEVEQLLDSGITASQLTYYGLEYKFITLYLLGEISYDTMVEHLNIAIHQFAKRQMTWFRKMEREGTLIHWINGSWSIDRKMEVLMKLASEFL